MSRVRARRWVAGSVLVAGVLLAGCGVTAQDRPVPIDRKEVPFGLLRETPPTTQPDVATSDTR